MRSGFRLEGTDGDNDVRGLEFSFLDQAGTVAAGGQIEPFLYRFDEIEQGMGASRVRSAPTSPRPGQRHPGPPARCRLDRAFEARPRGPGLQDPPEAAVG
ncbi:MAG: hypothetical protein R3F60_27815 [bacterium]